MGFRTLEATETLEKMSSDAAFDLADEGDIGGGRGVRSWMMPLPTFAVVVQPVIGRQYKSILSQIYHQHKRRRTH